VNRFDTYGWRRDFMASDLSKNARSVAHALEARMKNGSCFPGLRRIERDTRLSRNSVIDAIQELETGGWMVVQRRPRRQSNVYRAAVPGGAVAEPPAGRGSVGEPELQKPSRTKEAPEQQPSRSTSRGRNGSKPVEAAFDADSASFAFDVEQEAELDRLWAEAKP
jgi:DNA-binding transcriptional MocR family regulator